MYFKLKDGVKAAHHLRLAEKLYSQDDKINLAIIQKNLKKTYAMFDLNSKEFEDLETLHPLSPAVDLDSHWKWLPIRRKRLPIYLVT